MKQFFLLCTLFTAIIINAQSVVIVGGGGTGGSVDITVDDELNGSSTNPVENQVITDALDNKEDALGNPGTNGFILSSLTDGTRSWIDPPDGGGISLPIDISDVTALQDSLDIKANDNEVVKLTGAQNVDGVKTLLDHLRINSAGGAIASSHSYLSMALGTSNTTFAPQEGYGAMYWNLDGSFRLAHNFIGGGLNLGFDFTALTSSQNLEFQDDDILWDGQSLLGGGASSLADVLTIGNEASANIDMNAFNITGAVGITAQTLVATNLLSISGNQGFNMVPTDVVPSVSLLEGRIYADDSENRPKYYDGTIWRKFLLDGDGISEVADDTSPVLSGNLNAGFFDISNVSSLEIERQVRYQTGVTNSLWESGAHPFLYPTDYDEEDYVIAAHESGNGSGYESSIIAKTDGSFSINGRRIRNNANQLQYQNAAGTYVDFNSGLNVASEAQAEAGTDNTTYMTPLRTAQAIAELGTGSVSTEQAERINNAGKKLIIQIDDDVTLTNANFEPITPDRGKTTYHIIEADAIISIPAGITATSAATFKSLGNGITGTFQAADDVVLFGRDIYGEVLENGFVSDSLDLVTILPIGIDSLAIDGYFIKENWVSSPPPLYEGNNAADPVNEVNGIANITYAGGASGSSSTVQVQNGSYSVLVSNSTATNSNSYFALQNIEAGDSVTVSGYIYRRSGDPGNIFIFLDDAFGWVADASQGVNTASTGTWVPFELTQIAAIDNPLLRFSNLSASAASFYYVDNISYVIN